jgi:hypothetical protein
VCPVVVGGAGGDAQNFGRFLQGHADEITQLHQFSLNLVLNGEFVERLIHGEEFVVVTGRGNFHTLKVHALLVAAVAQGALAAGFVNQDAAHRLGGSAEEMGAAIELWIGLANQPQPGFMDERGGLQGLVGRFVRHFRRRELPQFSINQWQQFIGGLGVAMFDGLKYAGYVSDGRSYTRSAGAAPEKDPIRSNANAHETKFRVLTIIEACPSWLYGQRNRKN